MGIFFFWKIRCTRVDRRCTRSTHVSNFTQPVSSRWDAGMISPQSWLPALLNLRTAIHRAKAGGGARNCSSLVLSLLFGSWKLGRCANICTTSCILAERSSNYRSRANSLLISPSFAQSKSNRRSRAEYSFDIRHCQS